MSSAKVFGMLLVPSIMLASKPSAEILPLAISNFSSAKLDAWQAKSFKRQTEYRIVQLDQRKVLKARSDNSASALYREIHIDLDKTPYLNWSWRIENTLDNLNEKTKKGDDYAARVYAIISGGVMFWRTKAINYVWANNSEKGSDWPNAFAGESAIMVALRSKQDQTRIWYYEKRHVRNDLEKYFGEKIRYIDGIAIMTDTDNSEQKAIAYYGEIFFSAN